MTGGVRAELSSLENGNKFLPPTHSAYGEGNTWEAANARRPGGGGVKELGTYADSSYGNREVLRLAPADGAVVRIGNSNEVIR